MEQEGRNCCRRDGMRFSPWPVLLGVDMALFRELAWGNILLTQVRL